MRRSPPPHNRQRGVSQLWTATIGEIAILCGVPRSATVVARGNLHILRVSRERFFHLVTQFPQYDPARVGLVRVLLREGATEEAGQQLKYLAARNPDDPEILRLQLQMNGSAAAGGGGTVTDEQRRQAKETFAKLPEDSKGAIMNKVAAAAVTNQPEEGKRLIAAALEKFPGDVDIAGVCFDPTGASIYVASTNAIATWNIHGAEKRWWVDNRWM